MTHDTLRLGNGANWHKAVSLGVQACLGKVSANWSYPDWVDTAKCGAIMHAEVFHDDQEKLQTMYSGI